LSCLRKEKRKETGEKKEEKKTQFQITLLHMYRQSDSLMEGCEEAVCSKAREQDIL
jgi:hypothetical protein